MEELNRKRRLVFQCVDVIAVLTESKDPSAYWRKLKHKGFVKKEMKAPKFFVDFIESVFAAAEEKPNRLEIVLISGRSSCGFSVD